MIPIGTPSSCPVQCAPEKRERLVSIDLFPDLFGRKSEREKVQTAYVYIATLLLRVVARATKIYRPASSANSRVVPLPFLSLAFERTALGWGAFLLKLNY